MGKNEVSRLSTGVLRFPILYDRLSCVCRLLRGCNKFSHSPFTQSTHYWLTLNVCILLDTVSQTTWKALDGISGVDHVDRTTLSVTKFVIGVTNLFYMPKRSSHILHAHSRFHYWECGIRAITINEQPFQYVYGDIDYLCVEIISQQNLQ